MDKNQVITPEQMENIRQILRDMSISNTNQGLIMGNKNYFSYKDNSYRCNMPNQLIQMEAEDFKDAYKVKNMGTFPTEKQLKVQLKEKQGIDIDLLEKKRQEIREEYQVQAIKGASILTEEVEALEKQKKVISDIEERLMDCLIELEENLSTCLEKKVLRQYYRFLAFRCTEKRGEGGKWVPAWSTFEDFEKDDTGLTSHGIAHIQSLMLNTRE